MSIPVLVFMASAVFTMSFAKVVRHLSKAHLQRSVGTGTSTSDEVYTTTLSRLFRAVKNPSRHNDQLQTTNQIFADRKATFNAFCESCGLKKKAPKVIHVAGTKGKGSTVEYLASAIRSHGLQVGVFSSPHLHTARERIKVGHTLISKESIVEHGEAALRALSDKSWAVFFDYFLTVALSYFGSKAGPMDYLVLETGIGGRYDSTNFFDEPAAVLITSISLDHQSLLGETIEEIAWQKAGIIKPHSNVFTLATQAESVLQVFRQQCDEMKATLHVVVPEEASIAGLGLQLAYPVQLENACLSAAALRFLGVPLDGMRHFFWPCRMERLLVAHRGVDVPIVLDGCHNGDSVQRFLQALKLNYPSHERLVLFGAGMEKCLTDMITLVRDHADSILLVQSKHFKALTESQLLEMAPLDNKILNSAVNANANASIRGIDVPTAAAAAVVRHPDGTIPARLAWAIEYAKQRQLAGQPVVVALCGSLFVAAEAREEIFRLQPELFSEMDWIRDCDPTLVL